MNINLLIRSRSGSLKPVIIVNALPLVLLLKNFSAPLLSNFDPGYTYPLEEGCIIFFTSSLFSIIHRPECILYDRPRKFSILNSVMSHLSSMRIASYLALRAMPTAAYTLAQNDTPSVIYFYPVMRPLILCDFTSSCSEWLPMN